MQPVLRKEGRDKVTGKATYVDDQVMPGMLRGATIRTPCARGRIRGLTFAQHIPWDDFVVVTATDMPGPKAVGLITADRQSLGEYGVENAAVAIALSRLPRE